MAPNGISRRRRSEKKMSKQKKNEIFLYFPVIFISLRIFFFIFIFLSFVRERFPFPVENVMENFSTLFAEKSERTLKTKITGETENTKCVAHRSANVKKALMWLRCSVQTLLLPSSSSSSSSSSSYLLPSFVAALSTSDIERTTSAQTFLFVYNS